MKSVRHLTVLRPGKLTLGLLAGGLTLPAPAAAQNAPIDCNWVVTSPGPVNNFTGLRAGFMATPAGLQLTFTTRGATQNGSGFYGVTGFTGNGVYQPSGASGDMASGVFTLPDQGGGTIMIRPGNDRDVVHNGQIVGREPVPPTLTVTNYRRNTLQGILQGDFLDVAALARTPPQVVTIPVQIQFDAGSLLSYGLCR